LIAPMRAPVDSASTSASSHRFQRCRPRSCDAVTAISCAAALSFRNRSYVATVRPLVPCSTHRDVALHVVLGQVVHPFRGTEAGDQKPSIGLLLLPRPFEVSAVTRSLLVSVPHALERQRLGQVDPLALLELANELDREPARFLAIGRAERRI